MIEKQSWPTYHGEVLYRVTVRNKVSGDKIGVIRDLNVPSCTIPMQWLLNPEETELRVEVATVSQDGNLSEWSTWIPYYLLGVPKTVSRYIEAPEIDNQFPVRIIIRRLKDKEIILDHTRRSKHFPIPSGIIRPGLHYKFMRYDHEAKKWFDHTDYISLFFSDISSANSEISKSNSHATSVRPFFFTVDVVLTQ